MRPKILHLNYSDDGGAGVINNKKMLPDGVLIIINEYVRIAECPRHSTPPHTSILTPTCQQPMHLQQRRKCGRPYGSTYGPYARLSPRY